MRGGYRQNAGRKQGFAAKNAEESRKILSERLSLEMGPIVDVLITKAKQGDIRAIKELFDRAWGRPAQDLSLNSSFADKIDSVDIRIVNYGDEHTANDAIKRYLDASREVSKI